MLPLLCSAADISAARRKSPRTLKQMIELAKHSGISDSVDPILASSLGLSADTKQKVISYGDDKTPDHRQHDFALILDKDGKATELLWSNVSVRKDDKGTFEQYTTYLTSLSGTIKAAVEASGYTGEVVGKKLSPSDAKTKAGFKTDREFILAGAAALEFEKE